MKRLLPLLLLLPSALPTAFGQLPNGTVAPDWTMSDLDGVTHNLYSYLNNEKVVFIDFSATWCGPCWNYHNGGAFKTVYNNHGPSGTNDVMAFFIEGDAGTNTACLYGPQGCIGGTQGNWVAGTPYPIIDNASQTGTYGINYYPTIYGVCPDKKIYEVGQVSSTGLWNFAVDCSAPNISTASVTNIGCFGESNGTISISTSGGIGPFTYAWSNGATTSSLSNLPAGDYYVTVTGKLGGTKTHGPITVAQPSAPLQVQVAAVNPSGCNGIGGSAEVAASGGTANYSYLWNNGSTQSFLFNLSAGSYSCTVTDANGCTASVGNIVVDPPTPPAAVAVAPAAISCANATITLNGTGSSTGPNLTYLWTTSNGSIVSGENTLNNCVVDAPGTYELLVLNTATACTGFTSVVVEANLNAPTAATATPSALSCNNSQTTLSGSGSSTGTSIQYLWTTVGGNIVSGANTLNPVVNAVGSYTLTVTNNANGCTSASTVQVQGNTTPPNASANGGEINCTTTSVTLEGASTTPNATFAWSGPGGFSSNQASTPVSTTGTYTLVVSDPSNGCTSSVTTQVVQNTTAPGANATGGTLNCLATSLELGGSSPSGGASYEWSGPGSFVSNEQNPTVSEPGTYLLTVTGTNGCTSTASAIVNENINAPVANAGAAANLNCNTTSVVLNGTASSTGSQFSYEWATTNGNIVSGANTLTPVVDAAGTYALVVTNANNGCTATASTEVTVIPPMAASIATLTAVSCFGEANGAISLAVSGNDPFTYEWSNGATTESIQGLPAGTYSVVITDTEGCTASLSAAVTQPAELSLTANASAQTAPGLNDGTASASATGGTGNLGFAWSNGASTATIENLSPGSYTVTVTDENGCAASQTVTVNAFGCAVTATLSAEDISCFGAADGSASVSLDNAVEPYTFAWSNGESTAAISSLNAGTYTVSATDGNGCEVISSVAIQQPAQLIPNTTSTGVTAQGASDGTATANPNGGTEPFSFAWSNGETTATITGLPSANYTVTVTDANGCTAVQTVPVAPFACAMTAQITSADISCFGNGDGQATVTLSNGLSPFSYLWSNGESTATISNLMPGTYTASVSDAVNCQVEVQVEISEPTELNAAVTALTPAACGESNGTVSVEATGGTGMLSYQWSNGANTNSIENLAPGTYAVSVSDNNDCSTSLSVVISVEDAEAPVVVTQDITVTLGADGTATIQPDQVDNGSSDNCSIAGMSLDVSSFDCSALGTNEVSLTVTDGAGNHSAATAVVTVVDNTLPQIALQDITLSLDASGQASLEAAMIDNGSSDNCGIVSMTIDVSAFDCSQLGNHPVVLTVADAAGNMASGTAIVTVVDDLAPAATCPENMVLSFCDPVAFYEVTASDNCSDVLSYVFPADYPSGASFPAGVTAMAVSVSDGQGNTTTCSFSVAVPEVMDPQVDGTPILCAGKDNGAAFAEPTGGSPAYSFAWNTGATTAAISDLGPGTYSVTVTDADGCTALGSISLSAPDAVASTLDELVNESGNNQDGAISVTVSGGVAPYSFSWIDGQGTVISQEEDIHGLSAGNYSLFVTDANGCESQFSYTVQSIVKVHDELLAAQLSLFPNPSSGEVTLQLEDVPVTKVALTVFDVHGKLVLQQPSVDLTAGRCSLDLSHAVNGIYLVRILVNGQVVSKRLMINRW